MPTWISSSELRHIFLSPRFHHQECCLWNVVVVVVGTFCQFFIALKFCQKTCTYILALYNFFFFLFAASISQCRIRKRELLFIGKASEENRSLDSLLENAVDCLVPTSPDADLLSGHALELSSLSLSKANTKQPPNYELRLRGDSSSKQNRLKQK